MPKYTKEQFNTLLDKATVQMKNEIAKREVIPFRLDKQNVKLLQNIALQKKMHVGTLVRQWVLERLADEVSEDGVRAKNIKQKDLRVAVTQLQSDLNQISQHVRALKKCV